MSRKSKLMILVTLMMLCLLAGTWLLLFDKQFRSGGSSKAQEAQQIAETQNVIRETGKSVGNKSKEIISDWEIADRVYSHRGSAGTKEHSFEAYDEAIKAGSHNIEQDVVISSDGTLYVAHDLSAYSMTGVDRQFSDMTDAEIDGMTRHSGEKVLRLGEVFERYGKSVKYIVELRSSDDATIEGFQKLVEQYDLEHNIVAQSFESDVLDALEKIYPEMPKIFLCKTQDAVDRSTSIESADSVSVRVNFINDSTVDSIRNAGKKFSAWPLDSEEEIKLAISYDADSYFTNETARALEIERKYKKSADGPKASIILASDYQAEGGFNSPADTLSRVVSSAVSDGKKPDAAIICGDYSNDGNLHDYQLGADNTISEIKDIIREEAPLVSADNMIFVQGNHDALTDSISESGLHEYEDYLVYVLNTENDFPWRQGTVNGNMSKVKAASEAMGTCLKDLAAKGEKRPLIVAGHVPLHFTARTSYSHSTGDNLYGGMIFDVVNEAAKSLDITYIYGHNHSKGWDCYLGGSSVYRKPGDEILIPTYEEGESKSDKFRAESLNFTYMNAGYVGYYMNCSPSEYSSDADSPYRAADETLTCSVLDIYEDRIEITRYDEDGVHALGAEGAANPYKGGIDEDLIGKDHYSKKTDSPAVINRRSVDAEEKEAA